NPIFQELHTQMLAEIQAMLQPQLRPKYVARLERHLSEGSVWDGPQGAEHEPQRTQRTQRQHRKEQNIGMAPRRPSRRDCIGSGQTPALSLCPLWFICLAASGGTSRQDLPHHASVNVGQA